LGAQSAITTVTRSITVAAGVYAPGHLGELTRYLPFELVDAVLAEWGGVQRRLRRLPSRVGVYFIVALGLFAGLGYVQVWAKLVGGLAGLPVPTPSAKALRDLRRRVGVAPLRALFEVLAGPLAQPHTPGVRYRRWRTVAVDGCTSIKAPDAERSRSWLGKIRYRMGWAGYPTLQLMTLVETGTRGLLGAVFGPVTADGGEPGYARRLLHLLTPDMLLLADRGFDTNDFCEAVAATKAQFLIRIDAARRPPILAVLPDGSYLTRFANLQVRVIEAVITATTVTDIQIGDRYRIATTLLDHRQHPAEGLIRLYHERWEIESALYALRHTILHGRVLRSTDPDGLHQELWALLTLYQLLRMAMLDAIETRPNLDPDRASFTIAIEHARTQLTNAANLLPDPDQPHTLGAIGTAILTNLMPKRRPRTSARKVKTPTSRYAQRPPADTRPDTSTPITTITINVHPPTRHHPDGEPTHRQHHLIDLLNTRPNHHWHIQEIADQLGFTSPSAYRSQITKWARQGLIQRIKTGYYTLPQPALTTPTNP
jgi:hypothetical protein